MEKNNTLPSEGIYCMLLEQFIAEQYQEYRPAFTYQNYSLILLGLQQSQKILHNSPCYKNLQFKVSKNCNPKIIQTLSIMELKQTLISELVECHKKLQNYIQINVSRSKAVHRTDMQLPNENSQLFGKQLQILLSTVMHQTLEKLRKSEHQQHAYHFLSIIWKKNSIELIKSKTIQNTEGLIKLKENLYHCPKIQISAENKIIQEFSNKQKSLNPELQNDVKPFKSILSKINGQSSLKVQLLKLYNQSGQKLKEKQAQISKLLKGMEEFNEIIAQQMSTIDSLKSQKVELEGYTDLIHQQILQSEGKFKEIEDQIDRLQREIKQLNLASSSLNKQKSEQSYYLNPLYDKNQIEEKLLVEMIQLESDLFLGKNQIKKLTDSVIQIIKTSHGYLQELSATKYCLIKYDKSIYSIIKDLNSFESVELQSILPLKDDSLSFVDSYMQQEMKSSFMSINSQLQGDSKLSRMSRLTTQDSLILSGQDQ